MARPALRGIAALVFTASLAACSGDDAGGRGGSGASGGSAGQGSGGTGNAAGAGGAGGAAAAGGVSGVGGAGGVGGLGGAAGAPVVDPCKTATNFDPAIAKRIHQGSGLIDTPKDHPSTTPVPIVAPASCEGGKIDIVILPEGYLESELSRFEQDAALWLQKFLSLSPYNQYRDAFDVWTVRVASKQHIAVGGSDTAFGLSLTSGGTGVLIPDSAALAALGQPLFQALSRVPINRAHKQGSTLKQVVGVVLVQNPACSNFGDPTKACDGFSGWSRTPKDPQDASVGVKIAVARDHMHELGHALSNLKDEYRDDQFDDSCLAASKYAGYNPSNYAIDNLGNYSYSEKAVDLPWAHLLQGAGINPHAGVVGAYQGAFTCWEGAWRPEYRCLMNGTHGNSDSCNPSGGAKLRQADFCNWCRELTVLRVFDAIGHLDPANALKDWVDNYRGNYWQQFPVTLPNAGLPIVDSCGAPKPFEAPL